jgi:hypothetical protein
MQSHCQLNSGGLRQPLYWKKAAIAAKVVATAYQRLWLR